MKRLYSLAGLLVLLLLSACGARRSEGLTEALYTYQSLIRWGDFKQAASMLDPAWLAEHPISRLDWDRYRQIQISGYNAGQPLPIDDNTVQLAVEIEYINIHTQSPRAILDRQVWRYDEQAKTWLLTTGLPDLGAAR